MAEDGLSVKAIYTYPIKSVRGISLPSFSAMYTGFPHDRQFMLYSVAKDKNMHIAEFTEMCLFTTAFADDPSSASPSKVIVTYTKDHAFDKPDQMVKDDPLEIDLAPDTQGLDTFEVTMHSSPTTCHDMGAKYNDWFSERFGHQVKLLYIGENRRKILGNMPPSVAGKQRDELNQTAGTARSGGSWLSSIASATSSVVGTLLGTQQYDGEDHGLSFADVAPYLVISTKSWEDAQRRLPEGEVMDISKFRPNIIVQGAKDEYEEDYWAELQIGDQDPGAKFVLTQNCARCNSLNVDYNTGKVAESEAGKILKKLSSDRRVDPGAKWSPVFGRYGFLAKVPEGKNAAEVKVGDQVRVVRRNDTRTHFGIYDFPLPNQDLLC
ncbi:uncharacterized protein A1O9_03559 [Exophiala aquamarina CBS 119918]|uniref:MOSC domain-containing protein n=1 Tax=Exophiala aquamarina CBS 119918 TaxID=1182545 RepID=A0A072PQG0_9EURO|nr:uncharacterized protein A1O9_03559 [Exophiala aquamarina CBS 119918]KEF61987.1 hypothetical protein A1O9_03559 [Exophiala aquamarina CBS 119918]